MADLGGFNAAEVAPMEERSPLPAGEYRCVAVKSQKKPTSSGTGSYIEFTFQVVEGEYQGRMVWARLNLENPNQQAVEIARRELSSICRAVGVLIPQSTEELHDKPLIVKVAVKKRADTGDPTNEIKGYKAVSSGGQPEPVGAAPSNEKPSWM